MPADPLIRFSGYACSSTKLETQIRRLYTQTQLQVVIYVLSLSTDPTQLRWLTRQKNKKEYKNENCQKHIILVNLGLREYQNRIQHVHKSVHAKYELCSCPERRVMTILRPPGPKIEEKLAL